LLPISCQKFRFSICMHSTSATVVEQFFAKRLLTFQPQCNHVITARDKWPYNTYSSVTLLSPLRFFTRQTGQPQYLKNLRKLKRKTF